MSDRVQNEFGSVKPVQGGTIHMRPHLAVGPVPETAENAANAVAPIGASQRTSVDDVSADNKALLDMLGVVHKDADTLVRNAEHRKAVDEILTRLFQTRDHATADTQASIDIDTYVTAINSDIQTLENKFPGLKVVQGPTSNNEKSKNVAERVAIDDRARVIAKIDAALKRVEKLRSEITLSDDSTYSRLLNMGSAVSGLNVARNRIAETGSSLSSAANTADTVMVNLRAVVLATHGKISPEIVRLVLS